MFPILTYDQLIEKIKTFDAIQYTKTRNYLNGWVSQLSPYITHGVITIDEIVRLSLTRYTVDQAEMWYKELLWREYFVQVHWWKWDAIFVDMEEDKTGIAKYDLLPEQVVSKTFASGWVNQTILQLETTWYLHNHQRMWLASYMTHRQKLYRKKCADWTYYHFIDGELGSNHLSWQWVQSTFSHKPYFMNEENLTRYAKFSDSIYRGEYDDIERIIFDPRRGSDMRNSPDVHHILVTDLTSIPHAQSNYDWYTILTPRDLHSSKITDPDQTVCILDTQFLARHPWSPKRIHFVQEYCALYGIQFAQGRIDQIVSQSRDITIYETQNPYYRQAYEKASDRDDVTYQLHQRCSPAICQWYNKKFFPFWEKTKIHLYSLQHQWWN